MTLPLTGGCACGAIRYTCAREPIASLNCHCRDCQVSSGAPFASGIVVMKADLQVTGHPTSFAVTASSGGLATRDFCGHCGTPLFTYNEKNADFVSIRFPTLDDAASFRPQIDIWTASAAARVCLDEAIPHFLQSPVPPEASAQGDA